MGHVQVTRLRNLDSKFCTVPLPRPRHFTPVEDSLFCLINHPSFQQYIRAAKTRS
jgi:hypothetical protein